MNRELALNRLEETAEWDILVIGGGATGLGTAVDATTRGYKTLLLEQLDFAKGTSSRSTKLVHGGVRYLAQGDLALVFEALHERGLLKKNAPHLVHDQEFLVPNYRKRDSAYYTLGLKMYDMMAGDLGLGASVMISKEEVIQTVPNIQTENLRGGIIYHDGQFDDARLAINLAQTCADHNGTVINYMKVTGFLKEKQGNHKNIIGVTAIDQETGQHYEIYARVVINATGIFVDDLIQKDQPNAPKQIQISQGVHLVLDEKFLQGRHAVMIPKTDDGRVLFAVPWRGKVILGTTDTPLEQPDLEPIALEKEIDFILQTAGKYLTESPQYSDILSVFAGLRPLAAPQEDSKNTKEISRGHKINISESGLVTVIGGKWTTYRKMGEDVVDKALIAARLPQKDCVTKDLPIHGFITNANRHDFLHVYGSDLRPMEELLFQNPDMSERLHTNLPFREIEVVWAIRKEMARTVEDVLARRVRALFLDAKVAIESAPKVAKILARELQKDGVWQKVQIESFTQLAENYLPKIASKTTQKEN